MQLIIVTGLSGGGKSIAVRQLEDSGFYCIDNLPGEFLLPVAKSLAASGTRAAAVAIDARSHATFDARALTCACSFSRHRMRSSSDAFQKPAAGTL